METCEQPTDNEITVAVTTPAEPDSAAPRRRETRPHLTSQVVYGLWRPWTHGSITCWASATTRMPRWI